MARPFKDIRADLDTATDTFTREQLLTELRESSASIRRKTTVIMLIAGAVWLLVTALMVVSFLIDIDSDIDFLFVAIGVSVPVAFVFAITRAVRTFQLDRYASVIKAFEDDSDHAQTGSESR